jgi:hypothetical protein
MRVGLRAHRPRATTNRQHAWHFAAVNHRLDLRDARCDKMEDSHEELKKNVLNWQKAMEDLQLERQIEQLRRELEEAKTGMQLAFT